MARMVELNKGPIVGGPWDGGEHSVTIHPPDHPDGAPEVCRMFSWNLPGGAVYRWHAPSGEWRYGGAPDDGGGAFGALLRALGATGEDGDGQA